MKQRLLIKLLVTVLLFVSVSINVCAESVTYTQASRNETVDLESPSNAKVTFATSYTGNNYQLTANNSMTYTFSGFDGCIITGIALSMRSNTSKGAGSLDMKIGETTIASIKDAKFNADAWNGAWSTSYVEITPTITETLVGVGENLVITIKASANSLYCNSVTISYETSGTKAPTLPESDAFIGEKTIEIINNAGDEAAVYYTIDGTEPSATTKEYEGPFTITETTTVKAIAIRNGESSSVVEATYTKTESVSIQFNINGSVDDVNVVTLASGSELAEDMFPEVALPQGIHLKGWSTSANSTETEAFPVEVTEDMTLYAVFIQDSPFYLVADVNELNEGDKVVIANVDYSKAISTDEMIINGNSCGVSTVVAVNDGVLTPTETTRIFTLGKNGDYFTFENNDEYLACPEDDNRLSMQASDGNEDLWTIDIADGVTTITNKAYKRSIKYNTSSPRFACYGSGQKSISIFKSVLPETISSTTYTTVDVTSAGYATMYLSEAVAVPVNIEAYVATGVDGDRLIMQQVDGTLPAETGVILKAEEGEYGFVHSTSTTIDVTGNLLRGTLNTEYVAEAAYVLSNPNGQIGLYKAKLTDGKFLNNANKAYLPASAVPVGQQSNGFRFGDGTTAIDNSPLTIDHSPLVYDLAGRRVEKMEKGIYIVNGKKMVVR